MTDARWHVLGAGAIGCLLASTLHRGGCATTLLQRQASTAATTSVKVERDGASFCVEVPVSAASDQEHITHLLVTTKAQDVCGAVLSVAHRLDSSSQVLLLANGLGFAEELRSALPIPEYFFGTTTEGAYRLGDRHVRHAGRGLTCIGHPDSKTPPEWFKEWAEAVRPCTWDPEIDAALWLKLAINCAINPLTALHRCRNGELTAAPIAAQVDQLCTEIMAVSAAAGFAAVTADLPDQVADVIQATANNRSSMLQDVLAGRGTEIEYITGHLLQVAQRNGVHAGHNAILHRRIVNLGQ